MPINAQIPLSVQAPQVENPLNALAKVMQIRQMQQQGEMGDMQMQQTRQGIERQNQLRQLLGGFSTDMTPEQQVGRLTSGGFLTEARTLAESAAKTSKEKREAEKAQIENTLNKFKLGTQILSSVQDENSYQQGRQIAAQQGFDPWPEQYNPAWVQQNLAIGVDYSKRLEDEWKKRSEALTKRGQDITMRGQDMQNIRSKDYNEAVRGLNLQQKELQLEKLQGERADRAAARDAKTASIQAQIGVIDKALSHPGRETATGLSGEIDPRNYVPGTAAADFRAVLDQIGGTAFLQAFESLKGGGQITEVEGKKATEAIARLNRAQSDAEFEQSLKDLRAVMVTGLERQRRTTSQPAAPASNQTPTGNIIDFNSLK